LGAQIPGVFDRLTVAYSEIVAGFIECQFSDEGCGQNRFYLIQPIVDADKIAGKRRLQVPAIYFIAGADSLANVPPFGGLDIDPVPERVRAKFKRALAVVRLTCAIWIDEIVPFAGIA
jgi:hypothetical protein